MKPHPPAPQPSVLWAYQRGSRHQLAFSSPPLLSRLHPERAGTHSRETAERNSLSMWPNQF